MSPEAERRTRNARSLCVMMACSQEGTKSKGGGKSNSRRTKGSRRRLVRHAARPRRPGSAHRERPDLQEVVIGCRNSKLAIRCHRDRVHRAGVAFEGREMPLKELTSKGDRGTIGNGPGRPDGAGDVR